MSFQFSVAESGAWTLLDEMDNAQFSGEPLVMPRPPVSALTEN